MQQVSGHERVRRVRGIVENRAPGLDGIAFVRPESRKPEVELDDRGVGVQLRELLEPIERAVRPPSEGGADLRLERVVAREHGGRGRGVSTPVEGRALREIARLGIGAEAERERERRPTRAGFGVVAAATTRNHCRGRTAAATTPAATSATAATRSAMCNAGGSPPNGNGAAEAIVRESNGDVPRAARAGQVRDRRDLDRRGARAPRVTGRLALRRRPRAGRVGPGSHPRLAVYTGRGRLEQRIEGLVPDKSRPLIVYCSAGSRSASSVKVLEEPRLRERREPRERLSRTGSATATA